MHLSDGRLIASPTDLANFLVCKHKTALDLRVAAGALRKPGWVDPLAEQLRKRGEEHEARYVETLKARGLRIVDLRDVERGDRVERTRQAIAAGADAIIQAALSNDEWSGYADVLMKVAPGRYEAQDTKLARETKGGTILQLCVYTDLLGELQGGEMPERFHVVTPVQGEPYRFADFGAFYRGIKARFTARLKSQISDLTSDPSTYPEPTDHCEVCRWSARCNGQRRADDHLSFVHGLGRIQRAELAAQGITRLAELAAMPVPLTFVPRRGSRETYERLQDQARLQLEQRTQQKPVFECLPIEKEFGLAALPAPRPGDLFLDLEGDPFGRAASDLAAPGASNREYLFGLARVKDDGSFEYAARWSFSDEEERAQFDATMAQIMSALEADPSIHVYHYAAYEPTAFKRLMGRYAIREADVDKLLRGRRFVDLYAIVRHAVRAGVESYSIKSMEPFYEFTRVVELDEAGDQRRLIEVALESRDFAAVTPDVKANVEGYNKDDVISTAKLRDWLEKLREEQIAKGIAIDRPPLRDGEAEPKLDDKARAVEALRAPLLSAIPAESEHRTPAQRAQHLLAYLLDWHRREDRAGWWEYYRLCELPEADLIEEPRALAGLAYVCDVGTEKKSTIQRFSFPEQECDIRPSDELKLQSGKVFSSDIRAIDRQARTIDLLVGPTRTALHPTALFAHKYFDPKAAEDALAALARDVVTAGGIEPLPPSPARSLLLRVPPVSIDADLPELALRLSNDALAVQGPPGSGKTYVGARMIEALAAAGRTVGVAGPSHKVIQNLLKAVTSPYARIGHKYGADDDIEDIPTVRRVTANDEARAALSSGELNVLGGTTWLWARPEFAASVDVLFVDEAGQMSLANALAVSQAARSVVLLGDPQQLEQPQKGSHPDGVAVSSLEYVLDGAQTMPPERGRFLPETWRLAPRLCEYTSEVFYESKLHPVAGLERQVISGTSDFNSSGLRVSLVDHSGNRNASSEEAAEVLRIVCALLGPGVTWTDRDGHARLMTPHDIRIITPFNAQVARIQEALEVAGLGAVPVGTVDKFQGQEAAVAIYSLATSHPDDAPRGMEFLYSLNRLNVATSRARCLSIVVASPRLFEADCQTPRRMRLANALGRVGERAES